MRTKNMSAITFGSAGNTKTEKKKGYFDVIVGSFRSFFLAQPEDKLRACSKAIPHRAHTILRRHAHEKIVCIHIQKRRNSQDGNKRGQFLFNFDENHGVISFFLFLAQPEGKLGLLHSESITSSYIFQAPCARNKEGEMFG